MFKRHVHNSWVNFVKEGKKKKNDSIYEALTFSPGTPGEPCKKKKEKKRIFNIMGIYLTRNLVSVRFMF